MKCILYLHTGSDSDKAEELEDCLRGKLRNVADLKNISDILADEQDLSWELRHSDCVVLIGSRQASSYIQNKQQETEDGFVTFDGKVIHGEFTGNKELVDKLIIVYFTERAKNDWIPTGLDERRIFQLKGEKLGRGSPALDHLAHWIKRTSGVNML